MAAAIKQVTDDSYEEDVIQSPDPVLVDFWAPWCGPCRMLAPVLEELAEEMDGQVTFAKLNTDENMEVPGKLGIRGIPTLILYVDGEEKERLVGFLPKPELRKRLGAALKSTDSA